MKEIIGTNRFGYPQRRNFIDLPFNKYRIVKKLDVYNLANSAYQFVRKKTHAKYRHSFQDYDWNKVPLFHFQNTVSFGKTPWVVTYSTNLPRWGKYDRTLGIQLLAGDHCKKIIAMSDISADSQRYLVRRHFPEYADAIESKLMVLHPAQACPSKEVIAKDYHGPLEFTFVGHEFFRKGGKEILIAFDRLFAKGLTDWKLNVVSKLKYGDYISKTSKEDQKHALQLISKYPANIQYSPSLPNDEVLDLFKRSHVGLLPTWAEPYGYSVLESQAYGCPVITTDVRALPEINSDELGWVIEVKKNAVGTEQERAHFSSNLADSLEATIQAILENPEQVAIKSKTAYEKCLPSIAHNTQVLEDLYDQIIHG